MRCLTYCAASTIAMLAAHTAKAGSADALVTGKNATKLTEAEACRIASRLARKGRMRTGESVPAVELMRKSRQKRRAAQTKPGKRGR